MTSIESRVILAELKGLRGDISEVRDDVRELKHEDIAEIKAQVTKTNGRVDALERWKDRAEGAKAALGWVGPLLIAIASSSIAAAVTYLLTS